jgi:phasin family protein
MTEQMEKATENLMQMCDEVNALARAAVDANLKSVTAAARGWDESSKSAGHLVQENMSRLLSVGRNVAEAKSMRDLVTMQQDFMKDCIDLWMASTSKLSEITTRTAKDVVEPVAQHANETITRMMQKARVAA